MSLQNDETQLKFPGWGRTGLDWLAAHSTFVGIGVDTLSIELGHTQASRHSERLAGKLSQSLSLC